MRSLTGPASVVYELKVPSDGSHHTINPQQGVGPIRKDGHSLPYVVVAEGSTVEPVISCIGGPQHHQDPGDRAATNMTNKSSVSVGTVYFIRSIQSGLHKIGMTGNWDRRAKELGVGQSTELVLRARTYNPREVERTLHEIFKGHRLPQSEWFSLDGGQVHQVTAALQAVQKAFDTKQDDPTMRLLTLQARLAQERKPERQRIYRAVIRDHMAKHFPEKLRQQEEAAAAAEAARIEKAAAEARARWNAKPLSHQVLHDWGLIAFACIPLAIPWCVLAVTVDHYKGQQCVFAESISSCRREVANEVMANGLLAAGVGVAGTLAWSAMRLKRQKQLFLESRK